MSLLPLNTKPLRVKVSGKDDTVELYCSDMLPELDFQLLNGGDTAVTATSIDVEIYDYEEFSKKEIAEHTWLNKEPSEIMFEAGNVISSEAENEERYIYNNAKLGQLCG